MTVRNKQRLHLLLWKNWRLQMNRKLVRCFEYSGPVFFLFLLVALRVTVKPRKIPMEIHQSFDLHLENKRNLQYSTPLIGLSKYHQDNQFISYLTEGSAEKNETLPNISMQRFPYPEYIHDPFYLVSEALISTVILVCFVYPCANIVKYIATEKEMQLKEYMKILDVPYWIHWLAWFMNSFLFLGVIAVIITIFLKIKWLGNGVLNHSSWSAVLAFLLVYIFVSIFFCFMLAIFFTSPSAAAASSGLIWFLSSMPYSFLYATESLPNNLLVAVWCLNSNTALRFAIKFISDAESRSEGLQWRHYFTFESENADFPFAGIIIIMLLSSLLYLLICLYVEQIYPGDLCVGKKWYFPFTKSFWISQHKNKQQITGYNVVDTIRQNDSTIFEMEPEGKKAVIQLRDLKKKFNKKYVVHGISLNIYEDDITVLLGHSGSGKSVLISMMTGMCHPTSGTTFINGFDIQTNTKAARSSMCYCPQRNVLFPRLTVHDHLYFFGSLKGLQGNELRNEIDKYLKITDLDEKRNVYAEKLSDGMNRKLSVAIALCGGTKVVICDEPSSGMDPSARIKLWDLLLNEKAGRTIVLTTHYMDEADILGNRIAIISEGKLACCGTPMFLKKKYCRGYRLVCAKSENTDSVKVTALLQKYIPSLEPDRELGSELSYILPAATSYLFEKILIDFEENSNELQLNGYGLSCPTMEDVFIQINPDPSDNWKFPLKDNKLVSSLFDTNSQMLTGNALIKSQWNGLLRKKIFYSWHNKFMLLANTFMSVVYYAIFSILVARHWNKNPQSGPLFIDLTAYPKGYLILEKMNNIKKGSLEEKIANHYEKLVNLYPKQYQLLKTITDQSVTDYLMSSDELMQSQIDRNYLAGATIGNGKINAWFSNKHTAPLSLNLIHKAMAKAILGYSSDIRVLNDNLHSIPIVPRLNQLYLSNYLGEIFGINLGICMCFTTAYYIMFVIRERESRFKLLQFLSGIGVWTFWLTHLFWDFVTFSITALLLTITLACFQEEGLSTFVELGRLYLLLLLFSFSVLPFTYAFSWIAKDPAVGFARLTIINIFMGVGLLLLTERLHAIGSHKLANAFSYVGMMCPIYSLSSCINLLYYNRMKDIHCPTIWKQVGDKTELICAEVPICCESSRLLAWKTPGLLSYITALIVVGAVSLMILIELHYHLISGLKKKLYRKNELQLPNENDIDCYVIKEKEKVLQMTPQIRKTHTLVVDRLTKFFGNYVAVNQISFCVKELECFGLLGVNGAGKTTTFRILTGDESISYGWIYIKGISLISDSKRFRREFSFCPQRNALLEEFTGTETLQIFCYLYGIPKSKIQNYSNDLAKLIDLDKHMSKKISNYSGGNKRKLSFAVAMIGNPSVIYLDEPTCDMDPASRRQIWKILSYLREAGKSLVLTSHSMEECETLCTRLTIMVQGEFVCLGSVQHLKDKFNNVWILKIKSSSISQIENSFINDGIVQEEEKKYATANPSSMSYSNFIWQSSKVNEPITFNAEIQLKADNAKRSREMCRRGESYQKWKTKNDCQRTVDDQSGSQNLRFQIPSSSSQTNVNANLLKENSRKILLSGSHQQQQKQKSNQPNTKLQYQGAYYQSKKHYSCKLRDAVDSRSPCIHYHWNRCKHCGRLLSPTNTTQNNFNGHYNTPQYYNDCNWGRNKIMQKNFLRSAHTDIVNPMQNLYSIPRKSDDGSSEEQMRTGQVVKRNQTSDEENYLPTKCSQLDMEGQSDNPFQNNSFQTEREPSITYESVCDPNDHIMPNEEQLESGHSSYEENTFKTEYKPSNTYERVCDASHHTMLEQNLYDTSSVEAFIESAFDGATKERSYKNTQVFYIPATIKLSAVVGIMEEYKKFLNIEDYSVSQTTLEEIFVNFSKNQNYSFNNSQRSRSLFSTTF